MFFELTLPTFFAGVLTFLAPCTLPLVPAYLSFISGLSVKEIVETGLSAQEKRRLIINSLLYIVGFTFVFVLFGSLAGLGGVVFVKYRPILVRLGGVLIIIFGLYLLFGHRLKSIPLLGQERRFSVSFLEPGRPLSALLFGVIFALGWTPCVGPLLGSVLLLASQSSTVLQGALLLVVFSLGLGLPFFLVSILFRLSLRILKVLQRYLNIISAIGGIILIIMGVLIVLNKFALWVSFFYQFFQDLGFYDQLLQYL